jgi:putative chitinase
MWINYLIGRFLSIFEVNAFRVKSLSIDFARLYRLELRYKTLLEKSGINTTKRRCHFWAQIIHESNLRPIEENMNYSASRLLVIFPKYFNVVTAYKYANNPVMIANKVYGNRYGNAANEGYKFRGRGFIQTTFKDNYRQLSNVTGIDYVSNPERLLNEPDAMSAALYYWTSRKLNQLADEGDIKGITRKINGGLNGYSHRLQLLNILKVTL